jgi:hypothetical protein
MLVVQGTYILQRIKNQAFPYRPTLCCGLTTAAATAVVITHQAHKLKVIRMHLLTGSVDCRR